MITKSERKNRRRTVECLIDGENTVTARRDCKFDLEFETVSENQQGETTLVRSFSARSAVKLINDLQAGLNSMAELLKRQEEEAAEISAVLRNGNGNGHSKK